MSTKKRIIETNRDITGTEEEFRVRRTAIDYIDFDFLDVPTRLYANSQKEIEQWRYFFKDFVVSRQSTSPIHSVWVTVDGTNDSFIESIIRKDYSLKSTYIERDKRFFLHSRFNYWSEVSSPIPPFYFPPLNQRIVVFNSSAVRERSSDAGIMFLAKPYQGKSTLVNGLIRRGNAPLADNLAIVDLGSKMIVPYLTPTGIREQTLDIIPELKEIAKRVPKNWITISEVTGKVYLIHFDEIFSFTKPDKTPIRLLVYPTNHREGSIDFDIREMKQDEALAALKYFLVNTGTPTNLVDPFLHYIVSNTRSVMLDYSLEQCDLDNVVDNLLQHLPGES